MNSNILDKSLPSTSQDTHSLNYNTQQVVNHSTINMQRINDDTNKSEFDQVGSVPRKRSRRRIPINCSFCRRRKLKCNRQQPCSNCIKRNIQSSCAYSNDGSNITPSASDSSNNFLPVTTASDFNPIEPSNSFDSSSLPYQKSIPSMSSMSTLYSSNLHTSDNSLPSLYSTNPVNTIPSTTNSASSTFHTELPTTSHEQDSDYVSPLLNFIANQTKSPNSPFHPPGRSSVIPGNSYSATKTASQPSVSSLAPFKDPTVSHSDRFSARNMSTSSQNSAASINLSRNSFSSPSLSASSVANPSSSVVTTPAFSSPNNLKSFSQSIQRNQKPFDGYMHTRDGKSIFNSPISVNSLASLFNNSRSNTPQNMDSGSTYSKTKELQERLETMERMLITLINQNNNSNSSAINIPADNANSANSNTSTNGLDSPVSINTNTLNNSNSPYTKNQISEAILDYPCPPKPDDDLVNSLRESLGMLKFDTSGKSVYHGDTHWGSIISEIDDVAHVLGKLKTEAMKLPDDPIHDHSTQRSKTHDQNLNLHPDSSKPVLDTMKVGSVENPVSSSTGGCFWNNSYFATLQSDPSYMRLLETIPQREQCSMLIDKYFESINSIFPIVNRNAFEAEYNSFWIDPSSTEMSWMAMFLGMLCLGLQSYSTNLINVKLPRIPNGFEGDESLGSFNNKREPTSEEMKSVYPEIFREDAENSCTLWLEGAEFCANSWKLNFKPSLTNIRTMIILMLCQHKSSPDFLWIDKSWIDISTIIRVAQTIGLHRDPQWFALDEYEREERRRIWYLLQYFDTYFTVAQGLPSIIRLGTMDVLSPANSNLSEVAKRCRYFEFDSADLSNDNDTRPPLHDHTKHIPVKNEPLNVNTDLSFSLARSKLVLLCNWIYNKTNDLQSPIISYEKILEFDAKIRATYNSASKYLTKSVLEDDDIKNDSMETRIPVQSTPSLSVNSNSMGSSSSCSSTSHNGPATNSTCSDYSDNPDKTNDQTTILFERFLFEMEYLKTVMILHRKYSSRGLEDIKYRRSREETVHCAERILKLQEWFFLSKQTSSLRRRYSYIAVKFIMPVSIHSIILLSLYSVGNFESYSFHTARSLLRRIEVACNLCAEVCNKTHDLYISHLLQFISMLYFEAKTVFDMTPSERAELKRQRTERKLLNRAYACQQELASMMSDGKRTSNNLDFDHTREPPKFDDECYERVQYPGVPAMVNTRYHSDYNTFVYNSFEYDRVRRLTNKFVDNPHLFYDQWKLDGGELMDLDKDDLGIGFE